MIECARRRKANDIPSVYISLHVMNEDPHRNTKNLKRKMGREWWGKKSNSEQDKIERGDSEHSSQNLENGMRIRQRWASWNDARRVIFFLTYELQNPLVLPNGGETKTISEQGDCGHKRDVGILEKTKEFSSTGNQGAEKEKEKEQISI